MAGTLAAWSLTSASALAANAKIDAGKLIITDDAGAANDLQLGRSGGTFRIRDRAGTPTAGSGCTTEGAHVVTCPAAGVTSAVIALGDGDDNLLLRPQLRLDAITVGGGRGNDRIATAHPQMNVRGGDGADWIKGSPYADVIGGGRSDDTIRGGERADILSGGPGDDYIGGGPGPDLLRGGTGDDDMHGEPGNDLLRGMAGEDIVVDLYGLDRLYGGVGEDYLNTKDGETGDYANASKGPDYGCAASPYPGDILVGCDQDAGPFVPPSGAATALGRYPAPTST